MRDRILLLLFYRSERRKRGVEIEAFFFFLVFWEEKDRPTNLWLWEVRERRDLRKREMRERERGKLIIGDVNFYI